MSRGEEDRRLRQPVAQEVETKAEQGQVTAKAEGQGRDAEMLDRGVGEQALEVPLGDDERQRHRQAEEAEDHQQRRREAWAEGASRDEVDPRKRVERHRQRGARQERRDRARRLAVGVRQPGVERREPRLGPVAGKREQERQPDQGRIEIGRDQHQPGPGEGVARLAQDRHRRGIEEERPEQREADPDRAQDEVLPGRLDRHGRAGEADQQGRHDRRRLDRHPYQPEVVEQRHRREAGREPQQESVVAAAVAGGEPARGLLHGKVRRGAGRGDRGDGDDEHEDVRPQRVHHDEPVEGADGAGGEDDAGEGQAGGARDRAEEQRDGTGPADVGAPGEGAGNDRDGDGQDHQRLDHPRRLRRWSVEVVPRTSSMRRA